MFITGESYEYTNELLWPSVFVERVLYDNFKGFLRGCMKLSSYLLCLSNTVHVVSKLLQETHQVFKHPSNKYKKSVLKLREF